MRTSEQPKLKMKLIEYIFKTKYLLSLCMFFLMLPQLVIDLSITAQSLSVNKPAQEDDYYEIVTIPIPDDITLEVSGIDLQMNGDLVVVTRYGEVWLIQDPYMVGKAPSNFKRIASGLHTPMGITSKDGEFYIAQRSELTKLSLSGGGEIINQFRTVSSFEMSGNYCEYVHGPILLPDGNFWINMNLGHNWHELESFFGMMGHHAPWKGWAMIITPEGEIMPYASGLRSPAGMGMGSDATMYYSENEGDWVGTGFVSTMEKGDFFGHPSSLKSAVLPKSNTDLRPNDIPDREDLMMHEAVEMIPQLKMPSVRLPHGVMGTSLSWILEDTTKGAFGPFEGQLFVADQGQSKIMRIYMEEVNGDKQGAAFQFREGFQSGIIRSSWGKDGSMFVGMSNRGWSSLGTENYGLQRLVWTGQNPFEIKKINARPDGFELSFTKPVDPNVAANVKSYQISSFDYLYHKKYGSPIVDLKDSQVRAIHLSEDGFSARLVLNEMRAGYIYQINTDGLLSIEGKRILHPEAYYSLNQIPEGPTADLSEGITEMEDQIETSISLGTDAVSDGSQPKNLTIPPDSWESGPDRIITINATSDMRFDITNFEVKAGSKIQLVLNNPTDLPHNLLIVKPDSLETIAKQALSMGIQGPQRGYVPASEAVLFHTSLLDIETSESIYFNVPEQPGEYPFVCTFPGHWKTMQGIMKVVQ